MKNLLLLFGLTLLISCAFDKAPVQGMSAGTSTDATSQNAANQDPEADTWGRVIKAPPQTFFAADLSDDVRNGVTNTLLAATAEWGNYGPLEYWVLGTDKKAARDLAERFCERRDQLGQQDKDDCISHQMDTELENNFEDYRKTGAEAVALKRPGGKMGWNGNRQWGVHLYASSYPLGFDKRFGSSPGGEQQTLFHEYFHAVQQSHIQSKDQVVREALGGPPWFAEGGAEFMAQTTARKLWASGKLTIIDNSGLGSLEQSYENKMRNGKRTIAEHCPGILLGDITYDDDCAIAAYDLGAWAIGYLLNRAGQRALLDKFYPSLNELGWEGAFQKTFGTSSQEFYVEFNQFLEQPLTDQLAILPRFE